MRQQLLLDGPWVLVNYSKVVIVLFEGVVARAAEPQALELRDSGLELQEKALLLNSNGSGEWALLKLETVPHLEKSAKL